MALIHERLYKSQDLARISFAQYVRELASHLIRSYNAAARGVSVDVDIGNVALNIDTAIPCGLIITELVSNCLKHAFPDEGHGEVTISLKTDDQGLSCLTVQDNGIGLPPGLDPRHTQSLGLQLVSTLAGQLRATLDIGGGGGTCFTLRFHELPPLR
jgi:two-component sensor histidine kinase